MNRTVSKIIACCLLPLAAFFLSSCGEEEGEAALKAEEGIILELGELEYRVQLTRFLNRNDPEDAAYLEGVPPAEEDHEYLGVFIRIKNRSEEEAIRIPSVFRVVDTREQTFYPVPTESSFAIDLGTTIPPGGEIPAPETPAASGPVKGALILFELPIASAELRPLELKFFGPDGETATIELDI
ncbi:MAG: hypothetical protein ACR2K6_04835 [Solirubrobacterales bacterium]